MEELLQTQQLAAETELFLEEDMGLLLGKPYCGQYIVWNYHQGISTYGAPNQSI